MSGGVKSKLVCVALAFGCVFGFVVWSLAITQRLMIYSAPTNVDTDLHYPGMVRIIQTEFAMIYMPPRADTNKDTVVYLHGTRDQLAWSPKQLIIALHEEFGIGACAIEYPGYGVLSHLTTSSATIIESVRLAIRRLNVDYNIHMDHMIFIGRSLGCAVALNAINRCLPDVANVRLVLISPFVDLEQMLLKLSPKMYVAMSVIFKALPFLKMESYDNCAVSRCICRKFHSLRSIVIHGIDDELVPFRHGQIIANILGADLYVIPEGVTHEDVFSGNAFKLTLNAVRSMIN